MPQNKHPLTPNEKIGVALIAVVVWVSYVYFHYSFSSSTGFNELAYNFVEKFNLLILGVPLLQYPVLKGSKYVKANEAVPEVIFGWLLIAGSVLVGFALLYIRLKM